MVDGACWRLTAAGESCAEFCGGAESTDVQSIFANASSPAVVSALTSAYGLHVKHYQPPCGSKDEDSLYCYIEEVGSWECVVEQSPLNLAEAFRSPCLCRSVPKHNFFSTASVATIIFLLLFLLVAAFGGWLCFLAPENVRAYFRAWLQMRYELTTELLQVRTKTDVDFLSRDAYMPYTPPQLPGLPASSCATEEAFHVVGGDSAPSSYASVEDGSSPGKAESPDFHSPGQSPSRPTLVGRASQIHKTLTPS